MHKPLTSVSGLTDGLRRLYFFWLNAHENDLPPRLTRLKLHQAMIGMDRFVITEILHDAAGNPHDFEFLYVGRTINSAMHRDLTGQGIRNDPHKGPGSDIWAAYMTMAETPGPLLVHLPYIGPAPDFRSTQELFLPLHDDDQTPRFVLVGIEFMHPDSRSPQEYTPTAPRHAPGGRSGGDRAAH